LTVNRFRKHIAALGIAGVVAVGGFAVTGLAGSENTTLKLTVGPLPFVESGGDGFATAKFNNNGPSTVTQGVLRFDFTPGVASATFDSTCSQVLAGGVVTRVDCELGQVPPSPQAVSKVVRWKAQTVTSPTDLTIKASIFYKNDPNNNTANAPPVEFTTRVLVGRDGIDDANSACNSTSRSVDVATNTATAIDTMSGRVAYTADDLGLACYWAFIGEGPAIPTAVCGAAPCKTGFWFTSLPDAKGDLTLTIWTLPVSLSQFKLYQFLGYPTDVINSTLVPACDAAGVLPNTAQPTCELPRSREKFGDKGGIFHLRVLGSGRDPGYAG
jgi:hypothetical protein